MSTFQRCVLRIILAAMLAALAGCGGAATPTTPPQPTAPPDLLAGWIAFSPPDGSFTVRLPADPEVQEQTVPTEAGDVPISMYLVEDDDGMVMVATNGFPPAVAEVIAGGDDATIQAPLDGGRDGAISNVGGMLQEEKPITVAGKPGREFTFIVDADTSGAGVAITGTARVLLTSDRMIQLLSLSTADATNPALVQAFFDSFQFSADQ